MAQDRRTQAERTDETTAALIEATVTALVDVGYRGATTTEIARRAGVSRGAMLHHFPHRASLFSATADWLTDGHIRRFEDELAAVGVGSDRLAVAIDVLWSICSSPVHVAWMEFAAAAHHEPELAATITLAGARMRERTRETWSTTFPEFVGAEIGAHAADFALSLLEGLALSQRTAPDPRTAEAVVDGLKNVAELITISTPHTEET